MELYAGLGPGLKVRPPKTPVLTDAQCRKRVFPGHADRGLLMDAEPCTRLLRRKERLEAICTGEK